MRTPADPLMSERPFNSAKLLNLFLAFAIFINLTTSSLPSPTLAAPLPPLEMAQENPVSTLAAPPTACGNPLIVTSDKDDGQCGTLRAALVAAGSGPSKLVSLNLSLGTAIAITGTGLTVPAGVTIDGGNCTPDGPPIIINGSGVTGDGLTLTSSNIITGVRVGGFSGKQIKTPVSGGGSKLFCVAANTSLSGYIPPSDPTKVAPPLDTTVTTDFATETEFLYTGPNPIQTGVAAGTISRTRVAVLRGKITDRQGQPIPTVKITILSHPEYGQTLSQASGGFDMAVNGGSALTVNYSKNGYLPLQRQVDDPGGSFRACPMWY